MREISRRQRSGFWWALTVIVALIFLFVASSDAIYEVTSPPGDFQVLLRKSYSIVAFAIVGYLFSRAVEASGRNPSWPLVGGATAGYSLFIEVVQAFVGSHEGIAWNAIDVGCGLIGGVIGALVHRWTSKR